MYYSQILFAVKNVNKLIKIIEEKKSITEGHNILIFLDFCYED